MPSFMHTSRKPQCFNELQNRTNWSCSDRTFTISPIFRAKRIPAETALQVKTEMCASTRAMPRAGRTEGLRPSNIRRFTEENWHTTDPFCSTTAVSLSRRAATTRGPRSQSQNAQKGKRPAMLSKELYTWLLMPERQAHAEMP